MSEEGENPWNLTKISVLWRFDSGGSDIEYHFIAGIGYDKMVCMTRIFHIAYFDPYNGKNNDVIHWLNWTEDDDDFGFMDLK